jgi:hypothetical protein
MSDLEKMLKGILKRANDANGKIIGEGEVIEVKMAKSDRQAWINHLAEQYLKKEELDIPPSEFEITDKDIKKELLNREIDKILGK